MQNFVVEYCIGTLKGMLVQVLLKIFYLLVVSLLTLILNFSTKFVL